MSAVAERSAVTPRSLREVAVTPARRARNFVATVLMWVALALAAIPLGFLIYYVVRQGLKVMSWKFLTKPIPVVQRAIGPGMAPAIVGTLLITAMATLIAVPLGVLGAVYIVEYGADNRLARTIRFLGDVMAGVPSIVMGLFIYTVWVVRFHHFTGFAGSLALACLMLPIVIRSSESMLRLVPRELREASFALGTSRSRTVLTVVLPAAASGIVSGCLLAVARAAGETAPLLFTVGLVSKTNTNLFKGQNTSLSLQIFGNANQPYMGAQQRAWGAALPLMVIVLIFSIAARLVSNKLTRIPR